MAPHDDARDQYIALLLRLGAKSDRARYRHVYCNRDLNQAQIEWIGFDMDYTLAVYEQSEFDTLCHRLSMARLVERFGYPSEVKEIAYDPTFAIRGLVIDRQLGHIFKMDAHGHVERGVHGFQPLDATELDTYRRSPPVLSHHRFDVLDTLFHVPEAYVYASMVDYLEATGVKPDFEKLAVHVRYSVDSIHADGSLKSIVLADLPRFIKRDRRLGATLHRFRSAGKRLFLMTNSYWEYTDAVMRYLLEQGPADYVHWTGYFDAVVTAAKKPDFFRLDTPFHALDEHGLLAGEEHTQLRRGVVYQHGNLREFTAMTGADGDRVLYVGDHLYGDILRSKRDSRWRTVMIIPELEAEVRTLESLRPRLAEWEGVERELAAVREALLFESELRHTLQNPEEAGFDAWSTEERAEWEHAAQEMVRHSDRVARRARDLVAKIRHIAEDFDGAFHPTWGALMKSGNEHSIFGLQVERYACLYTSRATNFLAYSPVQYHRAPRVHLPHELDA